MAEKMPSSVKLGTRPMIARSRSYSSGFNPCAATSSGVISGSVMACPLRLDGRLLGQGGGRGKGAAPCPPGPGRNFPRHHVEIGRPRASLDHAEPALLCQAELHPPCAAPRADRKIIQAKECPNEIHGAHLCRPCNEPGAWIAGVRGDDAGLRRADAKLQARRRAWVAGDALQGDRDRDVAADAGTARSKPWTDPLPKPRSSLGGYYIIDCADLDAALRYAALVPSAAFGTVEMRPLVVW